MSPPYCDAPNAEKTCETLLEKGLQIEPQNLDCLQNLANIRIMRARDEEAFDILKQVCEGMLQKQNDGQNLPSIDFRKQTARLLQVLEKFKMAVKVLDTVIGDDDEDAETWYLLAFSHFNLKKYKNAKECVKNVTQVMEKTKSKDMEMKMATQELKQKILEELIKKNQDSDSENEQMEEEAKEDDGYQTYSEEDLSDDSDDMKN